MLQSVGSQRVGHDWETEQQHCKFIQCCVPSVFQSKKQLAFQKLESRCAWISLSLSLRVKVETTWASTIESIVYIKYFAKKFLHVIEYEGLLNEFFCIFYQWRKTWFGAFTDGEGNCPGYSPHSRKWSHMWTLSRMQVTGSTWWYIVLDHCNQCCRTMNKK